MTSDDGLALEPYRFLLRCLERPSESQFALLRHPEFPGLVNRLAGELGVPGLPPDAALPESLEDLSSTYIALFDAGLPQPLVPLTATFYCRREPIPSVLHEHMLFFQAFGMRPRPDNVDTPDHLLNQLEFLAALSDVQRLSEKPEAAAQAKLDFLQRHVLPWIGLAAERAAREAPALYATLLRVVDAWLRLEASPVGT